MELALTPQEKDALKAGVILACLLFIAVGYWYFYIVKDEVAKNNSRVTVINKEVKTIDEQLKALNAAKIDPELLEQKKEMLAKIAAKLPNSINAPAFYQALINILQTSRVDYSELTQNKPQQRSAYTEIPYKIVCKARYHDFGQFLNLVEENVDRFMRVQTFTIENDDQRPSFHPVTVGIATFMFNSKG